MFGKENFRVRVYVFLCVFSVHTDRFVSWCVLCLYTCLLFLFLLSFTLPLSRFDFLILNSFAIVCSAFYFSGLFLSNLFLIG